MEARLFPTFSHLMSAFWLHLWIIKLQESTSSLNYHMAVLKGKFKRKTKAVSQHGEGHLQGSLWIAELDCAGNPSQEGKEFPPYKLMGGKWGRISFAGKSELTKFQAKKKIMKMCSKQVRFWSLTGAAKGKAEKWVMHKGLQECKCTHTNLAVSLVWYCLNGLCCFPQPPLLFPALNFGLSKTLFRTVIFIPNIIHFSKLQLSCTATTFLSFKFT